MVADGMDERQRTPRRSQIKVPPAATLEAALQASAGFAAGYLGRSAVAFALEQQIAGVPADQLEALCDECSSDREGRVCCADLVKNLHAPVGTIAADVWREVEAVCFDVDSTVTQEEGIDKMAERLGKGEEIARVTKQAMDGGLPFGEALALRLEAMRPDRAFVERVAEEPVPMTPGIQELVAELQARGKDVFLVSGGFRAMIQPVAALLSIPADHVYANTILFNEAGEYAGFCREEPTSEAGGKAKALNMIMQKYGYKKLAMVGDGATDMEAKPPAAVAIGFGGNVMREKVRQMADLYVCDLAQLRRLLTGGPPALRE